MRESQFATTRKDNDCSSQRHAAGREVNPAKRNDQDRGLKPCPDILTTDVSYDPRRCSSCKSEYANPLRERNPRLKNRGETETMFDTFSVAQRLAEDSIAVLDLPLSSVRLANDRRFPWVILIPRRADLRELHSLDAPDRAQLMEEISAVSKALDTELGALKMNIAALGNQEPQLHVHIIARFADDVAWPKPIWSEGTAEHYEPAAASAMAARITRAIQGTGMVIVAS